MASHCKDNEIDLFKGELLCNTRYEVIKKMSAEGDFGNFYKIYDNKNREK